MWGTLSKAVPTYTVYQAPMLRSLLSTGTSTLYDGHAWHVLVSVGGRHPPLLHALEGALLDDGHADVGVAVGVVTLGLDGASGATGPTGGEPPGHERHL